MKRIGIIGAGISGLACARELKSRGLNVTVLEKSRSYGGRCATRLWNGHVVDHGAQFWTITDERFRREVTGLTGDCLKTLELPVVDFGGKLIPSRDYARYYHSAGNNCLGRAMAQDLDVRLESPVREIRFEEKRVRVDGDRFDAVVCSVPTPQLAGLLSWQGSPVVYTPCLTVFFEYEGDSAGLSGERYALSDSGVEEDLYWSSCENHKRGRIREGFSVFVVHTSEDFSRKHLEEDPSVYVPLLQKQLEEKWHLDPDRLKSTFAHRWRYARPVKKNPYPAIPPRFFLCGDGLVKARIEDVWLSGIKAAGDVLALI